MYYLSKKTMSENNAKEKKSFKTNLNKSEHVTTVLSKYCFVFQTDCTESF